MEENKTTKQDLTLFLSETGEGISLASKAFASGGEGSLFHILAPAKYSDRVVKIYYPHKRTAEKLAKLEILIKDPLQQGQEGVTPSFIWPEALLQNEKGEQIALMMPLAQGKKLELLCFPKLPKKIDPAWKRLAFDQADSLKFRLKIAFNLVNAIRQLQAKKKYVLVDLKPENILVQTDGQISIVDVDSLQISDDDQFFKAAVATPEYSAPEYYAEQKIKRFDHSWDNFALAIILYKLFFGIHPFAASARGEYESCTSLHEKIEAGLYVHHPKAKEWLKFLPPPHQKYEALPKGLKNLFTKTFVVGLQQAQKRANPEEWCYQLLREMGGWALLLNFEEQKIIERIKPLQLAPKEQLFHVFKPIKIKLKELLPNIAQELMALKKSVLAEKQIGTNEGCLAILSFFLYKATYLILIAGSIFTFTAFYLLFHLFWYLGGALILWLIGKSLKKSKQISAPYNHYLQIAIQSSIAALLIWGGIEKLSLETLITLYTLNWGILGLSSFWVAKIFSKQEEGHFFSLESLSVFLKLITIAAWNVITFKISNILMEGDSSLFWPTFKDYLPSYGLFTLFYFVGFFLNLIQKQKNNNASSSIPTNNLIKDYNHRMTQLQKSYSRLEANLQKILHSQKEKKQAFIGPWETKWQKTKKALEKRHDLLQEEAIQAQKRSLDHLLEQICAAFPSLGSPATLSDLGHKITALEKKAILSSAQIEKLKSRLQELFQEKEKNDLAYFQKMQEKYAHLDQDIANWEKDGEEYLKDRANYINSSQKAIEEQAKFKKLALNEFFEELDELKDQKKEIFIQKEALRNNKF
ncbi:serine/threonine protein kinase [Saprospira sp. CCB-QB6]|uniref:protein kinase domain-containing protein n=1 Tax=Saprospira sp. CCB-QB6 TaxID=3023936 RepID=UPI002349D423|nr:serine/threonine protein kinase [Saprospira sp. CCB-QB6]WCL81108.1 serine/threonine protein kinase [Saprospira sp. CCB-QB6]